MEGIVVTGELIHLTQEERVKFYLQMCHSMGVDYRQRPLQYFEQIDRNGRRNLILYALRNCATQLSATRGLIVGVEDQNPSLANGVSIFKATVSGGTRSDQAVGAVSVDGLKGKELADAIMAAQTKAKRRGILDFTGSALPDESEIEGMHGSVVELSVTELSNYAPPPAAPEASNAPASEVLDKAVEKVAAELGAAAGNTMRDQMNNVDNWPIGATCTVVVEGPSIPKEITDAADRMAQGIIESMKPAPSEQEVKAEQDQTTLRLNKYRKEILQEGGMKPSKGCGIAGKWLKFLAKKAPGKTVEEYSAVLVTLDTELKANKAEGVVNLIELEIA